MNQTVIYISTTPDRIRFEKETMIQMLYKIYGLCDIETFTEHSPKERRAFYKLQRFVEYNDDVCAIAIWDIDTLPEDLDDEFFNIHIHNEIDIHSVLHADMKYRYTKSFTDNVEKYIEIAEVLLDGSNEEELPESNDYAESQESKNQIEEE